MANQETFVTNAFETTLSSSLAAGATTINVVSTTGSPALPFYLVIEPASDAKREIVLVDSSKTATTFVLSAASKRGQDGTSDVQHDSGVACAVVPVAGLWTDINDRVDAAYTAGGTDVPVADGGTGASTAADARTNLGLAIGTDVQAHSAVLDATTASFTTADETKLDGVEALADVTDAANVAAAGAVMESDTSTASMSFVVDEDDMSSDSGTKVPTQQSVKAFAVHMEARTDAGTTDTLEIGDAGKVVRYTAAGAVTATVPPNSSVAFPTGTIINIYSAGAGGVTIAQGAGVTIRNNTDPLVQYAEVSLRKDGTDEWVRVG